MAGEDVVPAEDVPAGQRQAESAHQLPPLEEGKVFFWVGTGQPKFACQYDPCKMSSSFEVMVIETGPSA